MSTSQKPWEHAKAGGSQHDPLAAGFVESLSYDTRLYKCDITGSIAHARMLRHVGLIDEDDLAAIERGLTEIQREIEAANVTGWVGWKIELEDVHMCIEAALIERIGEPGRKLHTGRSRNDQVALDLQLWIGEAIGVLEEDFEGVFAAFVELAGRDGDVVMPSYTHLQRAQPIVAGGEMVAWLTAFDRCLTRLMMLPVVNSGNPLGSGAIAGSGLPLDRDHTAEALRVGPPTPSSIDATASRDSAADFVYALGMTAMTLSRWAEQWIIYMSAEFGFITIGEAYTTGSSMMPQKRNPDMLELIRGRCGNVYGNLVSLLTILKGLPVGYNRDLQEDKRHVFAAFDTLHDSLRIAAGIVRTAKFNADRIAGDMERGFADATSLADYLVTKGIAFRTAHQMVGQLVRLCDEKGLDRLADLSIENMRSISERIDGDVTDWLGSANVVRRYRSVGNAGLHGYRQQLEAWKRRLDAGGGRDEGGEDQEGGLFPGAGAVNPDADDARLAEAYRRQGRTLDDLPYTEDFERVYEAAGEGRSRAQLLRRLFNMRKAGKLPKVGRAKEKPPIIRDDQTAVLTELVTERLQSLSLRDQLPYTEALDEIVAAFNARTGLEFSPYQVWRVIAKLAK